MTIERACGRILGRAGQAANGPRASKIRLSEFGRFAAFNQAPDGDARRPWTKFQISLVTFKSAVEGIVMRSDRVVRLILSAAVAAAAWSSPAEASSCDREIVVRIQMAAGQACWTYRGTATTFVGDFSMARGSRRR
jgi:hypothetical protein